MWQLLLVAAAAAGSTGLVAKHLFSPSGQKCREDHQTEKQANPFDDDAKYQSPLVLNDSDADGCESRCEKQEGIFRFSSAESGDKSGFRSKSKNVRKKAGVRGKKLEFENEKTYCGVDLSKRRVAVSLKKRKTTKNVAAKCGSCYPKAGKAEISRLNTAMDETAKVVQELKSELSKRRSSCSLQNFASETEIAAVSEQISSKHSQEVFAKSRTGNRYPNDIKMYGVPPVDGDEYESSILTEERDPEVLEMDQLEAELESELQKLPWCVTEATCHEDMKVNVHETKESTNGFHEAEGQSSDYYLNHGVSPFELDQKLSRLLIEQQENQIVDLESELHLAQSKLHEKESELQVLKDCVRRLTEFSLSTIPEVETEAQEEQECNTNAECACNSEVEFESRQVVGMKRPIDDGSWSLYVE